MPTTSSFYTTNLVVLVLVTLLLGYYEHVASVRRGIMAATDGKDKEEGVESRTLGETRELKRFRINYLLVYALVMGSDWLQGPFLFSLYHDEYGIDLHTIAILFVIGFLSAGITAPYVGSWADLYGRKSLCILFTIAYALSCLSKMFKPLIFLASGRLLGGLATSILFSVFESWLVSSASSRGMTAGELGDLLGRCTMVNGLVAAGSGVMSEVVVGVADTFKAPFVASGALLVVAGMVISRTWSENYGGAEGTGEGGAGDQPLMRSLKVLRSNPSLMVVVGVMTAYETSMYLFVFLWVPTLQDSANPDDGPLPLGNIFSAFMIAMVLGSMLYNGFLSRVSHHFLPTSPESRSPRLKTRRSGGPEEIPVYGGIGSPSSFDKLPTTQTTATEVEDEESTELYPRRGEEVLPISTSSSMSILFHGELLSIVLLVAAASLAASVVTGSSKIRFYSFLVFEGTVGMYYPILGNLRSAMVPEECRATLSAIFRVPLNLCVTLALVTGMESRRVLTFGSSCAVLVVASVATSSILVKRAERGLQR